MWTTLLIIAGTLGAALFGYFLITFHGTCRDADAGPTEFGEDDV